MEKELLNDIDEAAGAVTPILDVVDCTPLDFPPLDLEFDFPDLDFEFPPLDDALDVSVL